MYTSMKNVRFRAPVLPGTGLRQVPHHPGQAPLLFRRGRGIRGGHPVREGGVLLRHYGASGMFSKILIANRGDCRPGDPGL